MMNVKPALPGLPVDALHLSHIALNVHVRSKKDLLHALAEIAARFTGLPERQVYTALMRRENASATGMCCGVAIPHARFEDLRQIYTFFVRLQSPVEYEASDGQPVDLVMLIVSPEHKDAEHLKTLATVSRLLRKRELSAELRSAVEDVEVYALIDKALNA